MSADEQADKSRGKSMPQRKSEVKEANVSDQRWPSGNPAEWPGVKVYRPRKLEHTSYDRGSRTIIDLDTGDALTLSRPIGPGDEQRTFGFYNQKTGPYVGGVFVSWSNSDLSVCAITSIRAAVDGDGKRLTRDDYDIERLAEMLGVLAGQFSHSRHKQLLVVDARPEKTSVTHPQDETQKDVQ